MFFSNNSYNGGLGLPSICFDASSNTIGMNMTSPNVLRTLDISGNVGVSNNIYANNFILNNPSSNIYYIQKTDLLTFTTGNTQTLVLSLVPVGLYYLCYTVNIVNATASSGSSTISLFTANCNYNTNNNDNLLYMSDNIQKFLPGNKVQTYQNSICLYNTVIRNVTFSYTLNFSGTLANGGSNFKTFIQMTKIG